MLPKHHLFLGFLFSLFLFIIFPKIGIIGFLLIIISSVLMDFDHYLYYVFNKKDLSLKNAYNWFYKRHKKLMLLSKNKRNKIYTEIYFLHGGEFLLILFVLGVYISKYFFYILIGCAFHLFLDIIHQRKIHDRLDRISLIHDFLKFRKLRKLWIL
ncbi:hypothetical protein KAI04_02100 [Candidatus Pacearchaeota archaeon]|nr:hypothetical protein [Candidatus Pacearchaeota archaeon]